MMSPMRSWFCMFLLFAACTPRFEGEVRVDGKVLPITGCRAGQATGFVGVDLTSADGTKLRLMYQGTAESFAYLFLPGEAVGKQIAICGPMAIERQSSRINQVHNHRGHAKLNCTGSGHSISGEISFENCH